MRRLINRLRQQTLPARAADLRKRYTKLHEAIDTTECAHFDTQAALRAQITATQKEIDTVQQLRADTLVIGASR